MARTILITNDDGILSDGILRLARAARKYGSVWVIAPEHQRSAVSHSITLHKPIDIYPCDLGVEDIHAYSCSGMPGDCVRVGALSVLPSPPDVVLSGINYGYNVASDIQYSATVGAAFEAEFLGYRAIALSERDCDMHEVTDAYLDTVLEKLIDAPLNKGQIWNVNFPGCRLSECTGLLENRTVSTAVPYDDRYELIENLKDGGRRYMVKGYFQEKAEEGSDFHAVTHNAVSVGLVTNIS